MQSRTHLLPALSLLLGCATGPTVGNANVDRIILAIGVDSIHSENEEARIRPAVAEAIAELKKKQPSLALASDGPV
jgi:hypothetical protein